jgi:hypothetical protein
MFVAEPTDDVYADDAAVVVRGAGPEVVALVDPFLPALLDSRSRAPTTPPLVAHHREGGRPISWASDANSTLPPGV